MWQALHPSRSRDRGTLIASRCSMGVRVVSRKEKTRAPTLPLTTNPEGFGEVNDLPTPSPAGDGLRESGKPKAFRLGTIRPMTRRPRGDTDRDGLVAGSPRDQGCPEHNMLTMFTPNGPAARVPPFGPDPVSSTKEGKQP